MDEIVLQLREASTLAGITAKTRFDWDKGIVYDVVLLGKHSKNLNTTYSDNAINDAFKVVESAGSYIDHSTDSDNNSRRLGENFGRFIGPYKNSTGELCAKEYHFNIKSSFAEDFKWACQNIPHRIGFSIVADGLGRVNPDGSRLVQSIPKVNSFDVVDQPATTAGIWNLKESIQTAKTAVNTRQTFDWLPPGSIITLPNEKNMSTIVPVETPKNPHAEIDIKLREQTDNSSKLKLALNFASKSEHEYIRLLATEIDTFQLKEAEAKKKAERESLTASRLEKAKLVLKESEYITPVFIEQLANAKDDATVQQLIDDRAKFALREQGTTVVSTDQTNNGVGNVKELRSKYFG